MDGQVTWSDLGFSFGRTLSEHSAATEEKTSTPCWKKLRVSQNIAGFPLIWERIHGKGTARWASEIEPFPIAVTKKHFPEEE